MLLRVPAALGVALVGVLAWDGPARADVSISPDRGSRGDAASVTLRITDDRPGAHTTRIEVRIPERTPVAEVFPMSVDGWGPSIATRRVGRPLPGLHRPAVTEVVSAITWIRTEPPGPGRVTELRISLGPLPDAERLLLPVVQTYSDGTVVTWADAAGGGHPAPTIALTPGRSADHGTAGGHGAEVGVPADPPAGADALPAGDPAPTTLGVGGQIGVALAGGLAAGVGLGVGYLLLGRRRSGPPDGSEPTATWRLPEGSPLSAACPPVPGAVTAPGRGPASP